MQNQFHVNLSNKHLVVFTFIINKFAKNETGQKGFLMTVCPKIPSLWWKHAITLLKGVNEKQVHGKHPLCRHLLKKKSDHEKILIEAECVEVFFVKTVCEMGSNPRFIVRSNSSGKHYV